jgi:hypothetical protein
MDMGFLWRWIGLLVLFIGICMFSVAMWIEFLVVGFISLPTGEIKTNWILLSIVIAWIGSIMVAFTIDW